MMDFLMLTVSFTLAMVLAGVISTVAMFALMSNAKAMNWIMNYYVKQLEKSTQNFEETLKHVYES